MKTMFCNAKKAGVANESKMWESIDAMTPVLNILVEEHPKEYWKMMRNQHQILWGAHYTEEFAEYDVSKLSWTGTDGQKHNGSHWSKEQVLQATKGKTFPNGTTDCDKYVAFNAYYADMCRTVTDEKELINQAVTFFFEDEDAQSGKIWRYMMAMNQ